MTLIVELYVDIFSNVSNIYFNALSLNDRYLWPTVSYRKIFTFSDFKLFHKKFLAGHINKGIE